MTKISNEVLYKAYAFVKGFKGSQIDVENNIFVFAFDKGVTEEDVMADGMLGKWFVDNGFNVSFEVRDFAYDTKGGWINYRGAVKGSGRVAYLRNRLVATITW